MEQKEKFIQAIEREWLKRQLTYPKILIKKSNKFTSIDDVYKLEKELDKQSSLLCYIHEVILNGESAYCIERRNELLLEIVREMNCRLAFYPRMVFLKRLSQKIAADEIAVWRELVEYWQSTYTPEIKIITLKTKIKIQCA